MSLIHPAVIGRSASRNTPKRALILARSARFWLRADHRQRLLTHLLPAGRLEEKRLCAAPSAIPSRHLNRTRSAASLLHACPMDGFAMRLRTTSLALLALSLGLTNLAAAKDPFSYFRKGATATTVSQTNAAGKQEGVVQPTPEVVQGNPAGPSPFAAPGPVQDFAPQSGYDGGPYAPHVFSVWPGVPACCDPWLGFCQEPRHYSCAKGQGRYIYYVPPCVSHGQVCGGHFITWAHGKDVGGNCNCNCGGQPVAYAGGQCDSCVGSANVAQSSPTLAPAPAQQSAPTAPQPDAFWQNPNEQRPPRNALPPPSARTISTGVLR
jgi:hypothetical protein